MEWGHGGDLTGYQMEYGAQPLDFSANISPLGLPEGVRRAAAAALAHGAAYPDPLCRILRRRLAEKLNLPAENILCGNGAADLIYRLAAALKPRQALITAPSFSEYEAALTFYGCHVQSFPLRKANGFLLTEEFLSYITPETELVLLCQPNNPTGRTASPALLREILTRCRVQGTLLAVDECFLDFLDCPTSYSLLPYLAEGRLLLLRAFTKFYGMAGLRLGFCLCGETPLLAQMAQAGPPWAVSSVAQAAGEAALQEDDYARRLRALIQSQRPIVTRVLRDCGCEVIPGEANYLLFFHRDEALSEKLKERGILIRDCRNYRGLEPGWYRTALRTPEENQRLIKAMREVTG